MFARNQDIESKRQSRETRERWPILARRERCHQVVSARPLHERREYTVGSPSAEERYAVEICCTQGD